MPYSEIVTRDQNLFLWKNGQRPTSNEFKIKFDSSLERSWCEPFKIIKVFGCEPFKIIKVFDPKNLPNCCSSESSLRSPV